MLHDAKYSILAAGLIFEMEQEQEQEQAAVMSLWTML
jgi:hypothetical protein